MRMTIIIKIYTYLTDDVRTININILQRSLMFTQTIINMIATTQPARHFFNTFFRDSCIFSQNSQTLESKRGYNIRLKITQNFTQLFFHQNKKIFRFHLFSISKMLKIDTPQCTNYQQLALLFHMDLIKIRDLVMKTQLPLTVITKY